MNRYLPKMLYLMNRLFDSEIYARSFCRLVLNTKNIDLILVVSSHRNNANCLNWLVGECKISSQYNRVYVIRLDPHFYTAKHCLIPGRIPYQGNIFFCNNNNKKFRYIFLLKDSQSG